MDELKELRLLLKEKERELTLLKDQVVLMAEKKLNREELIYVATKIYSNNQLKILESIETATVLITACELAVDQENEKDPSQTKFSES